MTSDSARYGEKIQPGFGTALVMGLSLGVVLTYGVMTLAGCEIPL